MVELYVLSALHFVEWRKNPKHYALAKFDSQTIRMSK